VFEVEAVQFALAFDEKVDGAAVEVGLVEEALGLHAGLDGSAVDGADDVPGLDACTPRGGVQDDAVDLGDDRVDQ
jgi:hypothetical protein